MFRIPFLDKTWQNHISRAFFFWLALFELFFYRRLGDKETKMMIWPVDTACVNQREISGRTKDGYSHRDWGYYHSNGGWLWQATHGKHHVADKYSLACFFKGGFSIDKWMIWIDPLVLWKVINNPLINVFFFLMGKSSTHFWVNFRPWSWWHPADQALWDFLMVTTVGIILYLIKIRWLPQIFDT